MALAVSRIASRTTPLWVKPAGDYVLAYLTARAGVRTPHGGIWVLPLHVDLVRRIIMVLDRGLLRSQDGPRLGLRIVTYIYATECTCRLRHLQLTGLLLRLQLVPPLSRLSFEDVYTVINMLSCC